ncbi:35022_t:CDS:1, partial [Gigaspora margarita]
PVLEENIELIQKEINTYEQKILDSAIIIEYQQQLTTQKQKAEKLKNQIETKIFLNDINIEIPFEKLPEINEENFPVTELKIEKLSSYEIQIL